MPVVVYKLTILNMEKDISLDAINSHKNEADSTGSGRPEDHNASDNIDTVPEEENETNTEEENQDENSKGAFFTF